MISCCILRAPPFLDKSSWRWILVAGPTLPTISYHFMADIHSTSEDRLWLPSFLPALLLQVFELLGEELPDATSYLGRLMKAKKNQRNLGKHQFIYSLGLSQILNPPKSMVNYGVQS